MSERPRLPPGYKIVAFGATPVVKWWGRLTVTGLDQLPASGPTLLAVNHDSYWDPVAIAVATRRRRQLQALAKDTLWEVPIVRTITKSAGHIPVKRGSGDREALTIAEQSLRDGACIGIFIEGTRSLGRDLRARSGLGHLAAAVPEAEIVCCRVTGTVNVPRLAWRPRIGVEFYRPAGGGIGAGEKPREFSQRLLDEIREGAPRDVAGRKHRAATARGRTPVSPSQLR
jgi:1-acyl-sn-glycerol-3-phosphate acyltransferase